MNRAPLLFASVIAALMMAPALASAQCPDGAIVCADVQVSGSVSIGARRTVQVVAQPPQPTRQVVVVQQQVPPPPPPQPVVVQQQQQYPSEVLITVEQNQPQQLRLVRRPMNQKFALTGRISAMIGDRIAMGGFQAGVRFRPSRIFGVELSIGGFGGQDYNGLDRVEVPFKFDAMFFLPRASRFQMYLLAGLGSSWAAVDGYHSGYGEFISENYAYIGGEVGIGMEWRVATRFALSADVRGFLRTRVDGGDRPEFVRGRQSTDTSAGALFSLGAHLYF